MSISSSRRRFRPVLECLSLRLAPSGPGEIILSPMDPTLTPWEPALLPEGVGPMAPMLEPVELPGGVEGATLVGNDLATDAVLDTLLSE